MSVERSESEHGDDSRRAMFIPANGQPQFSREAVSEAAALFKTLGDPTRALVVLALRQEARSVTELAAALGMTLPAVCHHLRVLQNTGLAQATRVGREVRYRADAERLRAEIQLALTQIGAAEGLPTKMNRPILIGSALSLTGFDAISGLEQKRALGLVLDQWNGRGGIHGRPIDNVIVDVGDASSKRTLYAFKALVEEYGVDAIVTGYAVCSGDEHELIADSGTPYIHLNTSETNRKLYASNPEKYWMCFQCDPSNRVYALGFPRFLLSLERQGAFRPRQRTIAIIAASDPYSLSLTDMLIAAVRSIGWRISTSERVRVPCEAWDAPLAKIRASRPDVIFLCDYALDDNITFFSRFLENPTRSLYYGHYGPTLPEFQTALGPRAEGTITSTVGGLLPGNLRDQYISAYTARWGVSPGVSVGGVMYDAANLYLTAASLAGGPDDKRRVCACLDSLWVRGTTGVLRFSRDHVVPGYPVETSDPASGMPYLVFQIQKGRPVIIHPAPYLEARYVPPPWFPAR